MGDLVLRATDLRKMDGQPRISDVRLGDALGFASPVNVRKLIRRNARRLERHGPIFSMVEKFPGQRRGPASTTFYLNERQAYRVCMWSEAPNADAVQEQMIDVFYDYRHGRLAPPVRHTDEWAVLRQRIKDLEALFKAQALFASPEFSRALAYAPSVFRFTKPDGAVGHQRYPKWWHDAPVKDAVIAMHRTLTISDAVAVLVEKFGADRAPSRSSLHRFWKDGLDPLMGIVVRSQLKRVDDK